MRRIFFLILLNAVFLNLIFSQESINQRNRILFQGIVMEKEKETPLPNTQIFVNRKFSSVSNDNGRFAFYALKKDTVTFTLLGYKPAYYCISDTLTGMDFVAGIYLSADTVLIDEVVILPRLAQLKSDILSPKKETGRLEQNASNNFALSAYQARITQSRLGDPALNYEVIRQRQKEAAFTKGQIPSDQIVGLSPLMLIPAAYLLLHGLPEKPELFQPDLSDQEVNEIHKRYIESVRKK